MAINRVPGLLTVLTLSLILGCGARAPLEPLLWPAPPDEPKIAYVGGYRGQGDIQTPSFLDYLLGQSFDLAFQKPYGVYAHNNMIYVTDTSTPNVVVLDLDKQETRFINGGRSVTLQVPIGVAVSADGSVYVSDVKQGKVFVFGDQGNYKATIGKNKGEMIRPAGLAINDDLGRLYVADSEANMVYVYSLNGERLFSFGKSGEEDGDLHNPTNIAIDRRNADVIVADTSNFRVQIFDQDGKFKSKFGELGDTFGYFSRPKGIGVDSDGHIYVADAAFNNFQIFSRDGQLLTYIGSGGFGPGMFQLPAGLYIDGQDRIYVADQMNSRVQVFQYLSEKWKKEHPEEYRKLLPPQGTSAQNKTK